MSESKYDSPPTSTVSCCSSISAQLKLYQAFIFSVPIFFTFILLFFFYLFYLRRRRADWSSLRMRTATIATIDNNNNNYYISTVSPSCIYIYVINFYLCIYILICFFGLTVWIGDEERSEGDAPNYCIQREFFSQGYTVSCLSWTYIACFIEYFGSWFWYPYMVFN